MEVIASLCLLLLGFVGLLVGGMVFVSYGLVLTTARVLRYRGACGCSEGGVISDVKVLRAWFWALLLFAVGVTQSSTGLVGISIVGSLVLVETAFFLTSLAVAPGARWRAYSSAPQAGRNSRGEI
jgi:hypothetical protein